MSERELRQSGGRVTLLPDEAVNVHFRCQDCGHSSSTTIIGGARPTTIDLNEERTCPDCEKKSLIHALKEGGNTTPDEELARMPRDQLMALHARKR